MISYITTYHLLKGCKDKILIWMYDYCLVTICLLVTVRSLFIWFIVFLLFCPSIKCIKEWISCAKSEIVKPYFELSQSWQIVNIGTTRYLILSIFLQLIIIVRKKTACGLFSLFVVLITNVPPWYSMSVSML